MVFKDNENHANLLLSNNASSAILSEQVYLITIDKTHALVFTDLHQISETK